MKNNRGGYESSKDMFELKSPVGDIEQHDHRIELGGCPVCERRGLEVAIEAGWREYATDPDNGGPLVAWERRAFIAGARWAAERNEG